MERDELLKATQEFFFQAMLKGYLGSAQKFEIYGMPGFRGLRVKDVRFELLDRYSRRLGSSRKSFGETVIWYNGEPIWVMQYRGHYEKRAIPFLKLALGRAYQEKEFNGGRGPRDFGHSDFPGLHYRNEVHHWNFDRYNGRETIMDNSGEAPHNLGWHEYNGLFLA